MKHFNHPQTYYLARLAGLVSDIDDHKQGDPQIITFSLHSAKGVIDEMKMDLLDIGQLDRILDRMKWASSENPDGMELLAFIEDAHGEIMRLLGDEEEACHA